MPISDGPRPPPVVSRFDAIQWAAPKPPSLATALDQAAVTLFPVIPVKAVFAILGGLAGALLLPWGLCLAWVLGAPDEEPFRPEAAGESIVA